VIADRFVASTIAYQGTAGGVEAGHIAQVARIAIDGAMPDLTIVFDVDPDTASTRLSPLLDRMEAKGRAFHERVRAGYHAQIAADPGHFLTINAARAPRPIYADLIAGLTGRLAEASP
jgi:dTMP kinase